SSQGALEQAQRVTDRLLHDLLGAAVETKLGRGDPTPRGDGDENGPGGPVILGRRAARARDGDGDRRLEHLPRRAGHLLRRARTPDRARRDPQQVVLDVAVVGDDPAGEPLRGVRRGSKGRGERSAREGFSHGDSGPGLLRRGSDALGDVFIAHRRPFSFGWGAVSITTHPGPVVRGCDTLCLKRRCGGRGRGRIAGGNCIGMKPLCSGPANSVRRIESSPSSPAITGRWARWLRECGAPPPDSVPGWSPSASSTCNCTRAATWTSSPKWIPSPRTGGGSAQTIRCSPRPTRWWRPPSSSPRSNANRRPNSISSSSE